MTPTPFNTALFRATPSRALSMGVILGVLGALLSACGGGDAAESSKNTNTGSFPDLLASTPFVKTALHVGSKVHFEGGNCWGGNSELSATWYFGDGSDSASSGVHTYLEAGEYQVRVECRDTAGSTTPVWTFVNVLP